MDKLIFDQKDRVNKWAYQKVGRESPFEKFYAIGVERRGRLIAGVIFDNFATEVRCSMHCVGVEKNWCSRALLRACFDYAFNFAKCKVIVNIVESNNVQSLKFTKHVGFEEVGVIKNGAKDGDLIVLAMQREQCRWLGD